MTTSWEAENIKIVSIRPKESKLIFEIFHPITTKRMAAKNIKIIKTIPMTRGKILKSFKTELFKTANIKTVAIEKNCIFQNVAGCAVALKLSPNSQILAARMGVERVINKKFESGIDIKLDSAWSSDSVIITEVIKQVITV